VIEKPHPDNIALAIPTRNHLESHKPWRGLITIQDPIADYVKRFENSYYVTYWYPPCIECRTYGWIYDVSNCVATWVKI
jgi:hypothetical protein